MAQDLPVPPPASSLPPAPELIQGERCPSRLPDRCQRPQRTAAGAWGCRSGRGQLAQAEPGARHGPPTGGMRAAWCGLQTFANKSAIGDSGEQDGKVVPRCCEERRLRRAATEELQDLTSQRTGRPFCGPGAAPRRRHGDRDGRSARPPRCHLTKPLWVPGVPTQQSPAGSPGGRRLPLPGSCRRGQLCLHRSWRWVCAPGSLPAPPSGKALMLFTAVAYLSQHAAAGSSFGRKRAMAVGFHSGNLLATPRTPFPGASGPRGLRGARQRL